MKYYEETIANCDRELATRRARSKAFIIGEVLAFLLAIGAVALYTTDSDQPWNVGVAVLFIVLYLFIRRRDSLNDKAIARLEDVRSACVKEQKYVSCDFTCFPDGSEHDDASHPFAVDLDIFGTDSLFQRVCRTVTSGGNKVLADALKLADGAHDERREAIARLAESPEKLTAFKQWGQRGVADTAAVLRAFGKMQALRLPSWAKGKALPAFLTVYVVAFLVLLVGSVVTQEHLLEMAWWCIFNFFAAYLVCNQSIKKVTEAVGGLVKQLGTYVQLVALVEADDTDEPVIAALRQRTNGAGESLKALDNILQKLESRGNILGLFFMDMLFLWDFRILSEFVKWQQRYSGRFDEWIAAVSEYDMLVSMATFRYNESGLTTDATVVGDDKVVYDARGLFHPFLGRNAVRNDFTIVDRNFYIITGANMAGKSTFLRSLGINYVLAMNGMPVFADRLKVSRFSLFTSMRTTDDLTHGISYFNAELLRLRQILDSLADRQPHLIILDEILKGTNSEDKLSGSRMFLEHVARENVTGVIATHDLKLSAMADERPETFHNYCFEIALGTDVTYSYKITPGVARNQNATFLLRKMLKSPSGS